MALVVATNAWQACEMVGLPEGRIILAQAVTYVACAPKSNAAYNAINAALQDVRHQKSVPVPDRLRDGGPRGQEIGRGVGYVYPHDADDGYATQDYGVPRGTYYRPVDRGKEAEFRQRLSDLGERDQED
jgi:putative ATPase